MTMTRKPGTYSTLNAYLPRLASQRLRPLPKPAPVSTGVFSPLMERGASERFVGQLIGIAHGWEGGVTPMFKEAVLSKYLSPGTPAHAMRGRLMACLSNEYLQVDLGRWFGLSPNTIKYIVRMHEESCGVKG